MASENVERVSFTPIQQAYIDDLINRKYKEAFIKAGARYKAEIDRLKAEIEEMKTKKRFSFWRK